MEDIELVDFLDLGAGDAEAQGFFTDFVKELFTLGFGELFRVVEPQNRPLWVENHRSGHHRAAQRATAHFVDTGDQVLDQVEVQSHLHLSVTQ
ncbi:hypothetical protein D9M73_216760 [compost metagenome]